MKIPYNKPKKFFIVAILVATIYYILNFLFFSKNSFSAYYTLLDEKDDLIEEIDRLKSENAKLHKEYFELKDMTEN